MNYQETLDYIHSVQWAGHKPGLSRTETLLAALGNPQDRLKFVHIAGTNGKGSTAAFTASCLAEAGYKVGLYTSPYLYRFNERIQIGGVEIPDDDLIALVAYIRPIAEQMADTPTEFELITAIGMLYFAQQHCDIVVLEVGLGGTLDSTNVIRHPEVAVITALGLDHTGELGNTLAEVASAKAGIIKEGCHVVSYGGTPEADAVIANVCAEKHAPLAVVDFTALTICSQTLSGTIFDFGPFQQLKISLLGTYQPQNAATALTALMALVQQGWNIPERAIYNGLAQAKWPGRFELLRETPPFLLDGSHNPHGMAATAQSLQKLFPAQKFTFLLSVMADKNIDEILDILCPLAHRVITVTADNPRACSAETLAKAVAARGTACLVANSIPEGVALASRLAKQGVTCALGTLYFSADVKNAMQ